MRCTFPPPFPTIPEKLARRAAITPNLQVISGREAILGGVKAEWETPEDTTTSLWEEDQFSLHDFNNLAAYLARSTTSKSESDMILKELISTIEKGAINNA